ncbi:MAG: hypothetical protein DI565_16410 [Ancylobacter novellus]|uniref:Response regulatory domain-containing protein n=1 Tax=Ancylobacter novellus TaxID=921 RepID=A0A2W5KBR2_ANCNO|nr:MAG: hypothetical protein DI565_16410 [Ancylobacter novellus]
MRVLVVHHDQRIAEALAIGTDWAIWTADRWSAGSRLIEHKAFDAWILDESIVGDQGLRMLAALRSFGEGHVVLWLRMPGSGVADLIDALAAGVTDCLRNPVDADDVKDRLRRAVTPCYESAD